MSIENPTVYLLCKHINWAAWIILILLIAYGNLFSIPFKIQFSKYIFGTLSSTVALLLTQWAYLEKVRDAEQIFRTEIYCLSIISNRVFFVSHVKCVVKMLLSSQPWCPPRSFWCVFLRILFVLPHKAVTLSFPL